MLKKLVQKKLIGLPTCTRYFHVSRVFFRVFLFLDFLYTSFMHVCQGYKAMNVTAQLATVTIAAAATVWSRPCYTEPVDKVSRHAVSGLQSIHRQFTKHARPTSTQLHQVTTRSVASRGAWEMV